MTIYCDTSVLISLLSEDGHSLRATRWFGQVREPVILSDMAALEFAAVISRRVRSRALRGEEAAEALNDLDVLSGNCSRRSHTPKDFELAAQIARDFATKLTAADALHLASAINVGASLATFDERLAEAAKGRGVSAIGVE